MNIQRFSSSILCLLILVAPGWTADKKSASVVPIPGATDPTKLIWPLPPDPPRVRWLAEYDDMAKLKPTAVKKTSWVKRVTGDKTPDEKQDLKKPYGVTTDSHGRIYVADTERATIFIIDPDKSIAERREPSTRAPLSLPVGVAVDADDRLFVSDANLHSLICFSPTGEPLSQFGMAELGRPGGIAIDRAHGRLYVADAKESRIAVFDTKTFKFVRFLGGPDKPGKREPGKFIGPTNVAVDRQGGVYVADTLNNRVQIFDADGKFVRTFGRQGDAPGEFIRPKGIAVDSEGHVYVADAEFNNFQVFSRQGQSLLAVGTFGGKPGQFALLAGLYIDSEDRIYTTEMFHGRVQVFQYISQPGTPTTTPDSKEVIKASTR
jgi:DNA-binding beta-propeller fold protein YncE